ncbi:MAG TPA: NAD(P)/FAD-dependent oxidoreductase [Phycisphaerales bacterium]|nr:NAD(P)/FAD-dependent oxidoreductase [Phycisphaerales bacterium]
MIEEADIAIIGAGLAGLTCARSLAGSGLRVVLIDRKETLTERIHTTGIFVRKTLQDFDLPHHCLGPPVRHVNLFSPRGSRLSLHSPHDEFRVGRMGALYEHWLADSQRRGVEFISGARLVGATLDGAHTHLDLARGRQHFSLRARFIIGADGARSTIARHLGLDVNTRFLVGAEDVLRNVPLDGPPRFDCYLDPVLAPGYIAWVVHDGEEAHLGVGGLSNLLQARAALDRFRDSLSQSRAIDLTRAELVERRGGLIPVGGVLRRIASTRGLLVGDATGAVSPLTAGGLDPAIRLSQLAAEVARHYLHTHDPRVLDLYTGARFRPRFTSRLFARRILESVTSPALIELGFAVARHWPMRLLAWHVFFGRGSFPDVQADIARLNPGLA